MDKIGSSILPIERRKAILDTETTKYVSRGFRVIARSDTTAQLLKPKQFNLLFALISVVLFVLVAPVFIFILYVLYYVLVQKDETVYLQVDESGSIIRTK